MSSGEDRLIATYFKPLATAQGALGLTDDAAIYAPPEGHELVLTTDAVVSGIHFLPDDPPETVARKALRVNLSDLAAKGAHPAGCLLTMALPEGTAETWLKCFVAGLQSDSRLYGCPVYGGDTVRTNGPLWASITAFGTLPRGTMVKRAGAKPGDVILVTGTIGDAALGLKLLQDPDHIEQWALSHDEAAHLAGRYRVPQPRTAMAEAVRVLASAAMDVSDGLIGDLAKLCDVSGVSARVDAAKIPLSVAARRAFATAPSLIEVIATGGDDYEILVTIPAGKVAAFRELANTAAVPVTEIGEIVAGREPLQVIDVDGKQLAFAHGSFSHF
ncbi:thiamine-phosphate kinase [Pseudorhodoplanes sp.]|uniref:thiamine-phosphate kinase n=1 Tax=Pseudorhodoplanes sp. TaxID=1934341 RepID=UPI002CDC2A07|nr:thiamine-phosphate kinase [Pseudorhodoplanes sp.]HWV51298.1 thiamine-phosphate kinase [Pseudorhodoplanes sp.]